MNNPFRSAGIARTITLGIVVVGTAAVAVTHWPAPADHGVPDLPAKDLASWTMPLDRWVAVSSVKTDYAEDLLTGRCLRAAGYPQYDVPWRDIDAATAADARVGNIDPQQYGPLMADLAATRGYQGERTVDAGRSSWNAFAFDPAINRIPEKVINPCISASQRAVPYVDGKAQEASSVAVRVSRDAYREATGDAAVVATVPTWRTCLTAGYGGSVPARPGEFVTQLLSPTSDEADAPVSAKEIALARADLACQQSSGYRKALYDAEWSRQSRVTAADLGLLKSSTQNQLDLARVVDAAIAKYQPARPTR